MLKLPQVLQSLTQAHCQPCGTARLFTCTKSDVLPLLYQHTHTLTNPCLCWRPITGSLHFVRQPYRFWETLFSCFFLMVRGLHSYCRATSNSCAVKGKVIITGGLGEGLHDAFRDGRFGALAPDEHFLQMGKHFECLYGVLWSRRRDDLDHGPNKTSYEPSSFQLGLFQSCKTVSFGTRISLTPVYHHSDESICRRPRTGNSPSSEFIWLNYSDDGTCHCAVHSRLV